MEVKPSESANLDARQRTGLPQLGPALAASSLRAFCFGLGIPEEDLKIAQLRTRTLQDRVSTVRGRFEQIEPQSTEHHAGSGRDAYKPQDARWMNWPNWYNWRNY